MEIKIYKKKHFAIDIGIITSTVISGIMNMVGIMEVQLGSL